MHAGDLRKLKKLHALLGSDNPAEREAPRAKLVELLAKDKKTWNNLPGLLSSAEIRQQQEDDEPSSDTIASDRPASLDLIRHILRRHLHLTEHQFIALALWIAHTFKYHRFSVTPRLALLSPVRGWQDHGLEPHCSTRLQGKEIRQHHAGSAASGDRPAAPVHPA